MTRLVGPLIACGLIATATQCAWAEDAKPSVVPSLGEVLAASGITATGYVSTQYDNTTGIAPLLRQFDLEQNGFSLNQASLQVAYQPKSGFGGVVQVVAGTDAEVLNSAEGTGSGSFNVLQAYAQYVGGPMTIIGGKFLTLAGAEVIAPTGNTNISRSLTFFNEPLTHTGLRVSFAASDQLTLNLGVNNGWNHVHQGSKSKTVELGVSFAPMKSLSLALNGYVGDEPVSGGDEKRSLIDFVGTWYVTDALTLILNYDFGKQAFPTGPDAEWNTGAFYVNYAINPAWRLSLRLEELNDKDGFSTGVVQKVKEATLTFGYSPAKNFELRMEGRYDKADEDYFPKATGEFDDKQTSIELEGLFKF